MKIWFITGASRGLGRAFAEAALARGDRVAATARDTRPLGELRAKFGDRALPLAVDVTDREAVAIAVRRCHDELGGLDVVVNNAGLGGIGALEEATEGEVAAMLGTNLLGPLWVAQAALPYLRQQGHGHIIQVSSVAGLASFPMVGLYNASKWGLEGMSDALAQEVAEFGVKVTLLEPGAIRTTWAHTSMPHAAEPLDAYAGARKARLEGMEAEYAVEQPGDPVRAAEALLQVVDMAKPPLRLILGDGAFDLAVQAAQRRICEWTQWEDLSRSTDFDAQRTI
jgi:NAD(P)-dependent dehydrogenase (short-subunit alcohol dehydrogenase family)